MILLAFGLPQQYLSYPPSPWTGDPGVGFKRSVGQTPVYKRDIYSHIGCDPHVFTTNNPNC